MLTVTLGLVSYLKDLVLLWMTLLLSHHLYAQIIRQYAKILK